MNLTDQIADLCYHPLPQALALAGTGTGWLCVRRYRTAGAFFALGVLWLGLCATPAFAAWLQRGLEDQYPQLDASAYPTADAIVVLGGGTVPRIGNEPDNDLAQAEATRVGFGLELFKAGRASVMLISGDKQEAEHMASMLADQGVPGTALIIDNSSRNTHENAVHSVALLRKARLQHILLVTSPMHMPRAAATFRRQGLDVIPAPTIEPPALPLKGAAWMPQRRALHRSQRCLREYIGRLAYQLRGWA